MDHSTPGAPSVSFPLTSGCDEKGLVVLAIPSTLSSRACGLVAPPRSNVPQLIHFLLSSSHPHTSYALDTTPYLPNSFYYFSL